VYVLVNFTWAIVTHTSPRQLKMFGRARTLLWASLSGLNFFPMSRDLHRGAVDPEMMDITSRSSLRFLYSWDQQGDKARPIEYVFAVQKYVTVDDLRKPSFTSQRHQFPLSPTYFN
jgi:hypothetical protein